MNALVPSEQTDLELLALEEAAPRGKGAYSTPLEQVKQGFYHIVLQSHAAFRLAMVASMLNEKALEVLDVPNVSDATGFEIGAMAAAAPIGKLRERLRFIAGDGVSRPFEVNFLEDFYNMPKEVADKIMTYMPAKATEGMPLLEFMRAIESFGISNTVYSQFEGAREALKEKFVEPLDDLVEFVIRIENAERNERANDLIFHLSIKTDGSVYKELVQANTFEPYLLYLWLMNSLMNNERRGATIVSPRVVSEHAQRMSKLGKVRPKVNAKGFAIYGNGQPIFIPPSINLIDKFLDAANASFNENGEFDSNILTEERGFKNAIVYVDWVNDIMAYLTNTGKLETINLGQVHPLDKATEYMYLTSKVIAPGIKNAWRTLSASVRGLEPRDAVKYAETDEAKMALQTSEPDELVNKIQLLAETREGKTAEDVRLYHLMGHNLDDFSDTPRRVVAIQAVRALFRLLYEQAKKDGTIITDNVPDGYKSLGILYRLIGVEYILQSIALGTPEMVRDLKTAYDVDREKSRIDDSKKEYDIPNLDLESGGIHGFLPHQGRLYSCTSKSPSTMLLPVQTGGGKTIIGATTAIAMIENIRTIPMITTKGNLVKGTITELNAISGGKINAIPFRPGVIRAMKRFSDIKTFARFLEWYKALPPNTILVNAYSDYASRRKLFDDLDTIAAFADAPIYTTQYLMIIKLLGIRAFIGDESHQIKNPDSARSRNSYTAFSQGDVRALMSGTMVSNTVFDLVGQTRAASPYIFGDDATAFADMYGISSGLITDDDATVLKERLRATTAYHEATREDWSYMLPTKDDDILFAELTPLQMEFYNILMQEAYLLLLEEEKRKGRKVKAESDDEDEDDDDEDEDEDEEEDGEDGALLAKAKVHLQKVEAFLVAPDMNEQYMKWDKRPGGEDLVSPKVRLADRLIEQHLSRFAGNLASNKIIIFGWNRVASQHFMKYSKYANRTLHYTAGDMEVARRYETEPEAVIMCADEGSVREGFNWQMTSLILRMQSVWAPGDHEQTIARMYRPDPRGKYNRDNVRHIWLMAGLPNKRPSLDAVKMARLVSKSISNARLTYEGRMEWRRVSREFDDMKLLKMNLQLIFDATPDEIEPYFGNWKTFVDWENDNNLTAKRRLAEHLESKYQTDLLTKDKKIIDINKFISLAMTKITSNRVIAGSKSVWVPWTANAIPADPNKRGFRVMGGSTAPVGTVVYTQFGPAIIESILTKGVKVRLYDGRVIGMKKNIIMLVDEKKYPELVKIVKDPSKWRAHAMDVWGVTGNAKRPTNVIEEEEVIDDLDKPDEDDMDDTEIIATIINGWPALMVLGDVPKLKGISDWFRIDPFLTLSFRTWNDVDKFLNLLDSKVFVPDDVMDALEDEINEFKTGKALVLGRQIPTSNVRQFFREQHKKLGRSKDGKIIAKPFFISVEKDIKLAFDINSHEPRLISWLLRIKEKIPGTKRVQKNEAIWVNTFSNAKEAFQDLQNLKGIVYLDEKDLRAALVEIKDDIADLRKPRNRPSL